LAALAAPPAIFPTIGVENVNSYFATFIHYCHTLQAAAILIGIGY
jgi:uncharacterized membrane protein